MDAHNPCGSIPGKLGNACCRFCRAPLNQTFVDLGMSPLCESYLTADQLNRMEPFYPLHVYVCESCFLVQLEEYVRPEDIFSEYAYFSSYSDSWLAHARSYVDMAVKRFGLGPKHWVVEVASNDGYLLQYFVRKGIPALGIEPAANVAKAARQRDVPTLVEFFGADIARRLAGDGQQADLIIGNNVLAQVPNLNDFVVGLRILLKPDGVITLEVPHLVTLIDGNQLDTIYHEHFSYFSFTTLHRIFAAHELTLFDVEEIPTHGGSLRIYACHRGRQDDQFGSGRVPDLLAREDAMGIRRLEYYSSFAERAIETKRKLLEFLIAATRKGHSVAGYGAPGKGNTLLNYCGIRSDFIEYTVDRNPYKQGKFLPGTRVPIYHPDKIAETEPDYVLILPWNLRDEIMKQLAFIREWGGRFIIPLPQVVVYP